jgi:putative ATP-binding cassette transporter
MLNRIRIRLVGKLSQSELAAVEQIGRAEIYKRMAQETTIISESQGLLIAALHSSIMVLFTAMYIATLSLAALLTTFLLILGGLFIYRANEQAIRQNITDAGAKESEFFRTTADLVDGLKEIKMNQGRAIDMVADLKRISRQLEKLKIKTATAYNENAIFSQCFFYVLLGVVVFVLPRLSQTYGTIVSQLVATILFMIGPLSTVVTALPAWARANIAAESLSALERKVDESNSNQISQKLDARPLPFERDIQLRDMNFSYVDRFSNHAFSVGPVSLRIRQGEVVFIIGGNGSGKSTLLKLLTGLYRPSGGSLLVDGVPVLWRDIQRYRELVSIIFSDFHLFQRLYGLPDVDEKSVNSLLDKMQLLGKTSFERGCFSTLELSTGQRKRLALIVALLEDRPIIVFDEWAADQDPEFRRYFYEVLLKDLKKRGKTVIAVTHDDHYFQHCDKLVKMDLGAIEFVREPAGMEEA